MAEVTGLKVRVENKVKRRVARVEYDAESYAQVRVILDDGSELVDLTSVKTVLRSPGDLTSVTLSALVAKPAR